MGKAKKNKIYAVARGHQTGIFHSWADCEQQTSRFPGAVFKSFPTEAEATQYLKANGAYKHSHPIKVNKPDPKRPEHSAPVREREALIVGSLDLAPAADVQGPKHHDWCFTQEDFQGNDRIPSGTQQAIVIYTDGSCRGNGQHHARAGYGIYHHQGSSANFAGRLLGARQTNQRAELTAILEAVRQVPQDLDIVVYSDSQYSISCLTSWHQKWARTQWLSSKGTPVENAELIRECLEAITGRKGTVKLLKVQAHVGVHGNEMADKLANQGAALD